MAAENQYDDEPRFDTERVWGIIGLVVIVVVGFAFWRMGIW